jgi:diguanylate cyclase (GGDEF)-like protein
MRPLSSNQTEKNLPDYKAPSLLGGTLEFMPFTNRTSLRQRFLLYLGSLFLLLSILGGVSYYTLQITVKNFDQATNHELLYLRQQVYLRDLISMTNNPVHNYITYGDPQEQSLFNDLRKEADELFVEILDNEALTDEQLDLVHNSYMEWQKASTTAKALLSTPIPFTEYAQLMSFNNHIEGTIDLLYESHNINLKRIEDLRVEADTNFVFTQNITLAGFITGILTFTTSIISMFRFVLRPAQNLLQSMEIFGRGNLKHRIKVDSIDEFGALAVGFNRMAENLAKDQEKLAELAIRDSLTGLYNRREFERLLNDEIHRFRRHGHPVSLLILDIDHFKKINDRYGHQVGDEAIRTVADIITNESRTSDIIARYGGEELAIILPETDADNAIRLAERTCQAIAEFPVMISPKEVIPITVSIGAATVPDNAHAARDLVTAADLAMYEAKRNGRNCVRTASHAKFG